MKETIKKLPPELNEYKAFRVATITDDNKKVTIDVETGKWQRGAKATHPLYTLDDLRDIKLPKNADCIQFVPGGTPYTILDFDIDKDLKGKDLAEMKDHIENVVLQGFEGFVEDSSSKKGMHAYCKDKDLKKYIGKNKTKLRDGLYVEVFNSDFPIILTADYYPDNIFPFGTCPPKLLKALGDPSPASTEEKPSESILEAQPSPAVGDDYDLARMEQIALDNPDRANNIKNGYPMGSDRSDVDNAIASVILKACNGHRDPAILLMEKWMTHHREGTITLKSIKNKAVRAVNHNTAKVEKTAPIVEIGDLDSLTAKYAVSKEEREKRKAEEVDLYRSMIYKAQIALIVARQGAGKTALAKVMAEKMAGDGYKVIYLFEDASGAVFESMEDHGRKHGYTVIQSAQTPGVTAEALFDDYVALADKGVDVDKLVIIVDTLKKFIDVNQKESVKAFFVKARKLAAKGTTVIALGHAKKYMEDEKLIFDGVGDIIADADCLYYMYDDADYLNGEERFATLEYAKGRVSNPRRELSCRIDLKKYEAKILDEVVNIRQLMYRNERRVDVQIVKDLINSGVTTRIKLINELYDNSIHSKADCKKLILSLDGLEWYGEKIGTNNAVIYSTVSPEQAQKKSVESTEVAEKWGKS